LWADAWQLPDPKLPGRANRRDAPCEAQSPKPKAQSPKPKAQSPKRD
jgi:hypothetical protein